MKIIKPYVEIIPQCDGYEGMLKHIELCGRVCYKSEDKISDKSANSFVEMLKARGHLSVLEHGTVYLHTYSIEVRSTPFAKVFDYARVMKETSGYTIATNYRLAYESGLIPNIDDSIVNAPIKRVTARFVLPIAISREFIRHRAFSFSEQSTRYCNYSKDKFGNELTFIEPYWWDDCIDERLEFLQSCDMAEKMYLRMIKRGMTPQFARDVLPLATKTELIMTGFVDDWKNFFKQRCAESAHPQARELANNLKELFKINKLL